MRSRDPVEGEPGDEELASAAARGDEGAFRALAQRHWARIGSFCAAMAGFDPEVAREAAQDSLVRLFKALPRRKGGSSFSTFLYAVCRHAALDALRRRARSAARAVSLDEATVPDIHDEMERSEVRRALSEALATLKADDRALVYLHEAESVPLRELARRFGLPEGTVKSRLSRARAKLAGLLKEGGMEGMDG